MSEQLQIQFNRQSSGIESACQCRRNKRCRFVPGLGRAPGEGNATHSRILAWKTPWIEEPGRLQSIESQRVRHDWSDLACMMHSDILCFIYSILLYSFLLKYSWFTISCSCRSTAQSFNFTHTHTHICIYTHTHSFSDSFLIGYYKILSVILCYSVGFFCYLFYIQ